jgi:hypothetical protein
MDDEADLRLKLLSANAIEAEIMEILPFDEKAASMVALVGVVARLLVSWTDDRSFDQEGIDKFTSQLTEMVEIMRRPAPRVLQ